MGVLVVGALVHGIDRAQPVWLPPIHDFLSTVLIRSRDTRSAVALDQRNDHHRCVDHLLGTVHLAGRHHSPHRVRACLALTWSHPARDRRSRDLVRGRARGLDRQCGGVWGSDRLYPQRLGPGRDAVASAMERSIRRDRQRNIDDVDAAYGLEQLETIGWTSTSGAQHNPQAVRSPPGHRPVVHLHSRHPSSRQGQQRANEAE